MSFLYKKIFSAVCLLLVIWTGAASSAPLSQEDKEIAERILDSGLQSVAEQLKSQKTVQDFLFCPYGYRQLFHGLHAKYQADFGYGPLLKFLQMNPELREAYMEYISKEKVQEEAAYSGNFFLDHDPLTSDTKTVLKKCKFTLYDELDTLDKGNSAIEELNVTVEELTDKKIKEVIKKDSNILSIILNVFYLSDIWGFDCESGVDKMKFYNIDGTEMKEVAFFRNIIIPKPPKTMLYDDAAEEDSDSNAAEEDSDSNAAEVIRFAKLGGHKVFYLPFATASENEENEETEQHTMILVLPGKNEKSLKSVDPEEVLRNIKLCKQIVQHRKNAGLLSDSNEVKKGNKNLGRMNFYLNIPKFFIVAKHDLSNKLGNFFKKKSDDLTKLKEIVTQTTLLRVNEEGAEAGTITVATELDCFKESGVEINIDRPFAVMIVDQDDTLLFSSIVYNPEYTESKIESD